MHRSREHSVTFVAEQITPKFCRSGIRELGSSGPQSLAARCQQGPQSPEGFPGPQGLLSRWFPHLARQLSAGCLGAGLSSLPCALSSQGCSSVLMTWVLASPRAIRQATTEATGLIQSGTCIWSVPPYSIGHIGQS